jgi:hypothetical protein
VQNLTYNYLAENKKAPCGAILVRNLNQLAVLWQV